MSRPVAARLTLRSRSLPRPWCHLSKGEVPQDGGHAGDLKPAGSRDDGRAARWLSRSHLSRSRSAVEPDPAARECGGLVGGVVGSGVVAGAEQSAVLDRRGSASAERQVVVGVAHTGGPVTTLRGATTLFQGQGDPLGLGVEPGHPIEVEDLGLGAEDDRGAPPGERQVQGRGGDDGTARVDPGPATSGARWSWRAGRPATRSKMACGSACG